MDDNIILNYDTITLKEGQSITESPTNKLRNILRKIIKYIDSIMGNLEIRKEGTQMKYSINAFSDICTTRYHKNKCILISLVLVWTVILAFCLSGCNMTDRVTTNSGNLISSNAPTEKEIESQPSDSMTTEADPVDAYLLVIDILMDKASNINDGIEYLAVNTTQMVNLTAEGKIRLFNELERYKLTILDKTLDELEDEGYIVDFVFEKGLWIHIEDNPIHSDSITMEAEILRSGLAAHGITDLVIIFQDGQWQVKSTGPTFKA